MAVQIVALLVSPVDFDKIATFKRWHVVLFNVRVPHLIKLLLIYAIREASNEKEQIFRGIFFTFL